MGWQSPSWQVEIKAHIRRRDGYRCVACGMDQATHKKRYGRILEVHRITPGSDYSLEWGRCVTLCIACHDALEQKGVWGWVASHHTDENELARLVRSSADCDEAEEYDWHRRERLGIRLQELRRRCGKGSRVSLARLAQAIGMAEKTLRDWEAGRYWPSLPDAARLAKALDVSLDDLWREYDPDDSCLEGARERSDARALAFLARAPREGESLAPGTMLVREVVARLKQKWGQAQIRVSPMTMPKHMSGVSL